LVNILARAFYALGDILTPMRISIFCLAINLVFASVFLFVYHMGAGALGIANTLSSTFNLALLAYALRKKLRTLEMKETVAQFPLIGALALAAALIAWGLRLLWQSHIGHSNLPLRMGEVFVPMITATVFYFSTSYWLNAGSAREILQLVASKARRQSANPRP
jgi:peptidoglycan biosynthesis protein MviN/MurJ (putative lipid II flippase)